MRRCECVYVYLQLLHLCLHSIHTVINCSILLIYQVSHLLLRSLLSYFRSFSPKRWIRQFAIQRVFSSPSRQGRGGELSYVFQDLSAL